MSTDSSGGAGFPATTAPALSANYFQTPHPPRLLNQPISGAPGPRGGPLPCQPLGAYAPWGRITMATSSPDKLRADGLRPLGVQERAGPTGRGP